MSVCRLVFVVLAMSLAILGKLAIPTAAAEEAAGPPSDLTEWSSKLTHAYEHFHAVEVSETTIRRCPRLHGVAPSEVLRVALQPRSARIFSGHAILVSPLALSREELYRALLSGPEAPDFCVLKMNHLVLVWDQWMLELQVPCSAGALVHYEIGDFLDAITDVLGESGSPREALLSRCGAMKMRAVSLETLRKRAAKSRNLWGKAYPARRKAARQAD